MLDDDYATAGYTKLVSTATCTTSGITTYSYTIEVDGEDSQDVYITVTANALGHNWSDEWTTDDEGHWHACLNGCDEKDSYAKHTWSDWVVTTNPTTTEDGEQEHFCEVCKTIETEVVSATEETTEDNTKIIVTASIVGVVVIALGIWLIIVIKKRNKIRRA